MRKNLVIFTLLLVLALSGLVISHGAVNSLQDTVTITETTLAGDPAAAAGLTVDLYTECDYQLFWHTTYMAGTDPVPETDFSFSAAKAMPVSSIQDWVYLETGGIYFSMAGINLDSLNQDSEIYGTSAPTMIRPAAAVAERTQAGETRTETVYLHDYYQYYTIGLQFHTTGTFGIDADMSLEGKELLSQYFRIPVSEEQQIQVTITKDEAGNISNVECIPLNNSPEEHPSTDPVSVSPAVSVDDMEFSLYSGGIVTEDGLYLIIWTDTDTASSYFSEIAGGYGVYFIPVEHTEEARLRVATDQIQNIYPLDPETSHPVYIAANEDELLLFTMEQEQMVLTTLDRETWTPLQQLTLPAVNIYTVSQKESLLILCVGDGEANHLMVLVRDGDIYRLWLDTPMEEFDEKHPYLNPSFSFDGQHLAIACQTPNSYSASVYLVVYGQTGLLYAGEYTHNADRILLPMVHTSWDDNNLVLSWGQGT